MNTTNDRNYAAALASPANRPTTATRRQARAFARTADLGDPGLTNRPTNAVKLTWTESPLDADDFASIYGRKGI